MVRNKDWAKESDKFLRSSQWKLIRRLTFEFFEKVCTNCNSTKNIHLDHVISRVNDPRGLRWLDIANLQPLCEHCNSTIKGRKNTDYRTETHRKKCEGLTTLFEETLTNKGYETTWKLWTDKKQVTPERKQELAWQGKIWRYSKIPNITYDEVINKLNIDKNHKNFAYIHNYISFCLSDGQKEKNERKKRKKYNMKTTKKKMHLLNVLYENRLTLDKQQLISSIEHIRNIENS